jgi:hypothetical protein
LSREAAALIAQLPQVHVSVCGKLRGPSEGDPVAGLGAEIEAIKDCPKHADVRSIKPEDIEELWLGRTEDAKMQRREAAGLVGLRSQSASNAAIP